tara:strand:+ start:1172 stop:1738 length:567 start_codon:yes stop_codon:yes gene_type:complete
MGQGLDKSTLLTDIENAYKTARDEGKNTGADSDAIIKTLSEELAAAIKKYMETAKVVTDHIIPPGHVATALPPLVGAGATVSPGTAKGPNGDLKFSTDVDLAADIESAHIDSREEGKKDGADSDGIIRTLAEGIGNGVHAFAATGEVTTTYNIDGNVTVAGFMGPPPGSAPVPAFTSPATGDAQGMLT